LQFFIDFRLNNKFGDRINIWKIISLDGDSP
jgi:hypothetical protein